MISDSEQKITQYLQCIANIILLNGNHVEEFGLMRGKLGVSIFLYSYAKYTGKEIYKDFSNELFDRIYEEVYSKTPTDFSSGLTGLGWGTEYLIKHKLIDADPDEILSDIDEVISQNIKEGLWEGLSLQHIGEYGIYFINRLKDSDIGDNLFYKKHNLQLLLTECEKYFIFNKNKEIPNLELINLALSFTLQLSDKGLFPEQTKKLLEKFPELCYSSLSIYSETREVFFTKFLIEYYSSLLERNNLFVNFKNFLTNIKIKEPQRITSEIPIQDIIQATIRRLIYNIEIRDSNKEEFLSQLLDVNLWDSMLENIDADSLSLEKGWSGLGMLLLNQVNP